jgi:hypothetical protein
VELLVEHYQKADRLQLKVNPEVALEAAQRRLPAMLRTVVMELGMVQVVVEVELA